MLCSKMLSMVVIIMEIEFAFLFWNRNNHFFGKMECLLPLAFYQFSALVRGPMEVWGVINNDKNGCGEREGEGN